MLTKGVTLKGLEVFEALAQTGAVAQASERTGLSQPAVSQQVKNLEAALGTDLVDHSRRPMQLTAAGRSFLSRTQTILGELRQARTDLGGMDLTHLSALHLGVIDDFDNDVTPRLATQLAQSLSRCRFTLLTGSSFGILERLRSGQLQLGVAASTGETSDEVIEYPVMCDPFVLVAPREAGHAPDEIITALPFLRYEQTQLIAKQIAAHLEGCEMTLDSRFEIGAHLALMALSARGAGWALTTAAGYMRAARMHDRLAAHPLPFAPFERRISLFARADWSQDVSQEVGQTLRQLLQEQVSAPGVAAMPWLVGQMRVLE